MDPGFTLAIGIAVLVLVLLGVVDGVRALAKGWHSAVLRRRFSRLRGKTVPPTEEQRQYAADLVRALADRVSRGKRALEDPSQEPFHYLLNLMCAGEISTTRTLDCPYCHCTATIGACLHRPERRDGQISIKMDCRECRNSMWWDGCEPWEGSEILLEKKADASPVPDGDSPPVPPLDFGQRR